MIGYLRGIVIHVDDKRLLLNVNGVGYEIFPANSLLAGGASTAMLKVGDELAIHTYLNVKEDRLELFGFSTLTEKEMFMELLTVSGVGPKLSLAIISGLGEERLKRAILAGDEESIKQIPGVGTKSAKRVILELRSRFGDTVALSATPGSNAVEEAMAALVALGFTPAEASDAIFRSGAEGSEAPTIIKKALTILRSAN